MRYKYLLLLLALLALNTPISAEYFRHIGLSEGLTQPSVMSIHQINWEECGLVQERE